VTPRRWYSSFGVLAALVAIGVALALPSPSPSPSAKGKPADQATGPLRLADAWPAAKPATLAADVGGLRFQPVEVLGGGRLLGLTTTADLLTVQLVLRAPDGTLRVLRSITGVDPPTIAATAVSDDHLYWAETGDGSNGNRESTVWGVPLAGGAPVRLARDPGDILFYGSQYDLQVAQGRLWWVMAAGQASGVHSVPLGGGAEAVRPMDRVFSLTTWPWVTSSGASVPGDVELRNLSTGEVRRVTGTGDEILTCTLVWCRITTLVNHGQSLRYEVEHPDGTARRAIGDTGLTPLNSDVGIQDRFEVLTSTASSTGTAQRLWLHDLSNDRVVLLDDLATANMGARGDYLWWSTGDNETLTWHILDLRTLS
jgi:hypothetical protein